MVSFNPHKFVEKPKRYSSFANVNQPGRQPLPIRCTADCICDESSTTCPCVVNKNTCDDSCKCQSCPRRYPPCGDSGCDTKKCGCLLLGRQCEDGRCGCKGCRNRDGSHRRPPVRVKKSRIQGKGLFAQLDIQAHEYIEEYTGEIVHEDAAENDHRITLVQYSRHHCIKPSKDCKMAYINHQPEAQANACFVIYETAKGREIRIYAKGKHIYRGEEITVNYRLLIDKNSKFMLCKLAPFIPGEKKGNEKTDKGLILHKGLVVRVHNKVDIELWFALIERVGKKVEKWKGKEKTKKKQTGYLHVLWLERDLKTKCSLMQSELRQRIDVETVTALACISTHSELCGTNNVWCWSKPATRKTPQKDQREFSLPAGRVRKNRNLKQKKKPTTRQTELQVKMIETLEAVELVNQPQGVLSPSHGQLGPQHRHNLRKRQLKSSDFVPPKDDSNKENGTDIAI